MAELPTKGGAARQYWRGTIVANGTNVLTFTDPTIGPKSAIHLTLKAVGGTPAPMVLQSVTPTVGNVAGNFTVASSAGNTSTYNISVIG